MAQTLNSSVKEIIKRIPVLSDYYHYHWIFPRNPNVYRGVFQTFSEAQQAIPKHSRSGYNQPEAHEYAVEELGEFNPRDYSLLECLKLAFTDSSTVFDLGGGVGVGYYAYQKHIDYPDNLQWLVCDVPAAVQAGEKLAQEINSPGLSYTVDLMDAEGADIFITCGALQYLEPSLAELITQLKVKPRHILINRVPLYEGETYITLQNILTTVCPYKIQNRTEFIASLTSLGYELIDNWQDNRTCSIPFHPARFVDGYHGFYFRLKQAVE